MDCFLFQLFKVIEFQLLQLYMYCYVYLILPSYFITYYKEANFNKLPLHNKYLLKLKNNAKSLVNKILVYT